MSIEPSDRSSIVAATVIMGSVMAGYWLMPAIMMSLAEINEYLAYAVGGLFCLAFFGVFWLRARYQRRRDEKS